MRFTKLWLHCGVGFILLVVYLSLTPNPLDVGRVGQVKLGHFVAYGWLMFWFCQIYRRWPMRLAIAASFILMGVGLELAQGLTGYRSFAFADMVDNGIGVMVGLALGITRLDGLLLAVERRWLAVGHPLPGPLPGERECVVTPPLGGGRGRVAASRYPHPALSQGRGRLFSPSLGRGRS